MKISDHGLDLIRRFEGLKLRAYRCPAGIWTIGYGHTGPEVRPGLRVTREEAETLLRADAGTFDEAVRQIAGPATQGQHDALVSFAFNLGLGALMSSTLLKRHRSGDHAGAADQFRRWIHVRGRR